MTRFDQIIHIVANKMVPASTIVLSLKMLDIRFLKTCIRYELKISKEIAKLYVCIDHLINPKQRHIQNPLEHLRGAFCEFRKKLHLRCSTRF